MRSLSSQPPIRPQISTMPRPQTEAAAYLNIYKLVTEKKRLEQELQGLEQRRDRIYQQLAGLTHQIEACKDSAQNFATNDAIPQIPSQQGAIAQPQKPRPDGFSTLFLEY